ncbi:MAG: flagellar motor switch protein FliM [Clostridia bacterium]|nr:flagellar motor switch protein FliM [Clostridia bacterium]
MSDILSQNEIDELIDLLDSGQVDLSDIEQNENNKKVKVYDFRRPNKFAKDQLRTLQIIHENLSRLLSSYLSGYLRTYCEMNVASVEELTYYEFINSMPDPVVLSIIDMLNGIMIFEIPPNLSYMIIDRVLGGPGKEMDEIRGFTDIEITILRKLILKILDFKKEAWENVVEIDPKLEKIETNSQFAQIISPNETIALITVDSKIADVEGIINVCIPHVTVEPIKEKLSTRYWFSSQKPSDVGQYGEELKKELKNVRTTIRALLGSTEITLEELMELEEGDVIKLNSRVREPVIVQVGKRNKFKGYIGKKNNNAAVKIAENLYEEDETS